ncbi:MAG: LuxR C-terminal-related transcriptional regulator [Gemmatimonadales bacterium]|jgi:DNA-binding CsgD family transcriptional regulator
MNGTGFDPGMLARQRQRFLMLLDALDVQLVLYDMAGQPLHRTAACRDLGLSPFERQTLHRTCDNLARELARRAEDGTGRGSKLPRHRIRLEHREFLLNASVLRATDADPNPRLVVAVCEVEADRPPTERFGLTPRQAEVAELLARRLTNKEIAEALGISQHTVRHHAEYVFAKLGVHSRRDVARRLQMPVPPTPPGAPPARSRS